MTEIMCCARGHITRCDGWQTGPFCPRWLDRADGVAETWADRIRQCRLDREAVVADEVIAAYLVGGQIAAEKVLGAR